MESIGFKVGRYNASTYYHPLRDLKQMLHGDDFATVGDIEDVRWLKGKLEERFELKSQILGEKEEHEGRILNRVIRWTPEGWEYEADQRHAELLIKSLNLQDAKAVETPYEEPKKWLEQEESVKLSHDLATEYRSLGARANYLAVDRTYIQVSTKECCSTLEYVEATI